MRKLLSLLTVVLLVGSVWGATVTWTINGVNTTASGGSDVNTTLKTSAISPNTETGVWTAVASKSYAGSSSGAQFGSGSYTFAGTITLSGTAIPATAVIKDITFNCTSTGTAYKVNAKVAGTTFGSQVSINQNAAKNYSFTGSQVLGNTGSIVLTFSDGGKKNVIIKSISVTYSTDPSITLTPTVIDFGRVAKNATIDADTITVVGTNLTGNVALTAEFDDDEAFVAEPKVDGSLVPSSKAVNAKLVITPIPYTVGEIIDTLRINGGGLGTDTAKVAVKMTVLETYTIEADDEVENGIFSWQVASVDEVSPDTAGTIVQATYLPDDGYTFDTWDIYKKGDATTKVSHTNGLFTMPAYDVVISGSFRSNSDPSLEAAGGDLSEGTLAFDPQEYNTTSSSKTFTITGENLVGDVTWVKGGTDASMFTVTSPASGTIAKATATSGQAFTVTFTPTSTGTKTATLTFSTSGASDKVVTLTGNGVELYTVTLNLGGGNGLSSTTGWTLDEGNYKQKQASYEAAITLPNATLPSSLATAGWSFAGWKTSAVNAQTTEAQTFVNASYTPTEDITLFAVYKWVSGVEGSFKLALTSGTYYVGAQSGTKAFLAAVTDVKDAAIFSYENGLLSYDNSGTKTYISSLDNTTTLTIGTDEPTETWTESGTTTFTYQTSATGNRYLGYNYNSGNTPRFAPYNDTYDHEFTKIAAYTIYYNSDPTGVPTALDNLESNVKAVKVLKDGQIYILRGEKVYTIQGQLVK